MEKSLDDLYFLTIREGAELYHYGEGYIVDYYKSSIAYLDNVDASIVFLCDGTRRQDEIESEISARFGFSKNQCKSLIQDLFRRGVLRYTTSLQSRSINVYGSPNKFFPKEVAIELTDMCNYLCPFCYKNATWNGSHMTMDTVNRINQQIGENVHNILLTGGEPTIHPHFAEIIRIFTEYASVHIITNGSRLFHIDSEAVKLLDAIQFSIYGCDNQEYGELTGNNYGYSNLQRSVEYAQKYNVLTTGAITVCDKTCDHIEKFIERAIELGLFSLRIGIADVFGRGNYMYGTDSKVQFDYNPIFSELLRLTRMYRRKIRIELPNIKKDHVCDHQDLLKNVYRDCFQCGCGSEYLVFSPSGKIRPCQMLPEEYFTIPSANAFEEHINGDFHISDLYRATERYYAAQRFDQRDISPCEALEQFLKSEGGYYAK